MNRKKSKTLLMIVFVLIIGLAGSLMIGRIYKERVLYYSAEKSDAYDNILGLEDGQYLLKGTKMYPDIFLSDEQKAQLEQVGLMRGYLNGEELFTITRKNGLFWFQWENENEYRIVFRSTTESTHSEFSSLSWTLGDWVVRRPELKNPLK